MDKPHTLFGMPVYASEALSKPGPTTWVDRVIAWNPCNHWKVPRVPSNDVFMFDLGALQVGFDLASRDGSVAFMMHPSYIKVLDAKSMVRVDCA